MKTSFSKFAETTYKAKYAHDLPAGEKETWPMIGWRVATEVFGPVRAPRQMVEDMAFAINDRIIMPGGRYLYASGRPIHQVQNCLLMEAQDSREGWAELISNAACALMTGAGIGVAYGNVREEGALIRGTGGFATGPLALMQILNEEGRGIKQGGSRRSAIWAGLPWDHPDIQKFIYLKNWSKDVRMLKAKDFNFPATMDMTNISVQLNDEFFSAFQNVDHPKHGIATGTYWNTVERMLKTSEPGFSVDVGENAGEHLRNACTEVTSHDDSDVCNLVALNLSRIKSEKEMARYTRLATAFAVAGSKYSCLPYEKVALVRDKNRRLGIGPMGFHHWLLQRGKPYGPDEELGKYLEIYRDETDSAAETWAREWGLSVPVKTRAIAPHGTIGIVAETTTSIEPLLAVAYKRRYLKGKDWVYQYVIEPVAKQMIDEGHGPGQIENAHTISVTRRLEFQEWVQQYVDHGISSTINLPAWGSEKNNKNRVVEYGELFMKHLPGLRGLTVYADGSRDGQPIVPVPYAEAIAHEGKELVIEQADMCELSGKGTCE